MAVPAGRRSLGQRQERLAFLDDIGGEDRPGAAADVPHRVNRSIRDGQGVTGVERPRRLAFDLILQRPLKDIDDLFTRMRVLDCWRLRVGYSYEVISEFFCQRGLAQQTRAFTGLREQEAAKAQV